MTVYHFSPTAERRADLAARTRVADGLRHRGLAAVDAQLAQAVTAEPPTFRELAQRDGWSETADRVNRWAAAEYEGHWSDVVYDNPSPAEEGQS